MRSAYEISVGKPEGKRDLEHISIDEKVVLR
jgi:hypothetical protein